MRTVRTVLLGMCAALVMTIGLSTPAQAALSDCQSNETCMFLGSAYFNPHYDYNAQTHGCVNFGGSYVNTISSIVNNTNRQVWLFKGRNCWQGGSAVFDGIDPYTAVPYLPFGWNDNAESAQFD